jgi:hypothetical protein
MFKPRFLAAPSMPCFLIFSWFVFLFFPLSITPPIQPLRLTTIPSIKLSTNGKMHKRTKIGKGAMIQSNG